MQCFKFAKRWAHGAYGLFAAILLMLTVPAAHAAGDAQDGVSPEKPRVAFVLGNNAYTGVPPLENAVNDAEMVAASLRRLDFQVVEGFDLTLEGMRDLFVTHKTAIDNAEAVVLYYAGHAFQIEGQNYLVPTDAELKSALQIDSSTIRLDTVIRELQHPDRPTLIFLDACRDNPLPPSMQEGLGDGLAQIEAGTNTFIAFATQPGNVSVDGIGNNSPFATALVKHLETPGLSIADLVIEVRNETLALTLERQEPWDQSSLRSQFYFTERQRIDQRKLVAAFAAISTNENLRTVYEADLDANYSFQAAIFRTAHRAIEILDEDDGTVPDALTSLITEPTAPPKAELTLASLGSDDAATRSAEGGQVNIEGDQEFTVLGSLQFSRPGEEPLVADPARERERQRALARNMQTELQRLGCYRMGIDGLWGPGSRRAFQNFLSGTKQSAATLDPSAEWLNRLVLHSGRVCRAPVKYVPKKTAPKVASTGSSSRNRVQRTSSKKVQSFKKRAVRGQTRQAKRARRTQRQNALPPDLSMGVGIGM